MGLPPFRILVSLCGILALTACALPRGGAVEREILRGTTDEETRDLSVVPVTRANVAVVAGWPLASGAGGLGWLNRARGPSSPMIAAGDRIDLTIWDNDENSLLTATEQKMTQINGVTVSPGGTIFVPYIAEVTVKGKTPDQARSEIQMQLDAILSSPQVQLVVTPGRQNSVDLVGGVAKAGTYPLPDRDFSVLSLLSMGGGVSPGLTNPQLRLSRGNAVYGISVARLFAEPHLDTTLRGGDKVIVEADKRYFIALGASGQQDLIPFPKDEVSALDAVSLIGGVKEARANPKGVLILREYPATAVRADGLSGPDRDRVVFTLDMTTADGLFSARNFHIQPEDLVLATESPVNGVRTVLGLFGQSVGLVNAVDN
ncbi:polysaccharide export protein [Fertoebacter nigrum]|uniref:Polysaccharide export protein n=1 Tax=Fertoeibacter niger TaxID=2656921 RepID=A0A8X8H0G2_9RHOB|nr:polysaccharide biosynthesis/export family protein [Fertoeibacter niger]NUB46542.1 polysaccharide export protein [Fertoeibacter niger]